MWHCCGESTWEEIDQETVLKAVTVKPEIDRVHYVPGALLWSVDKKDLTKSGSMKLAGTKLYKKMTVRKREYRQEASDMMQARSKTSLDSKTDGR